MTTVTIPKGSYRMARRWIEHPQTTVTVAHHGRWWRERWTLIYADRFGIQALAAEPGWAFRGRQPLPPPETVPLAMWVSRGRLVAFLVWLLERGSRLLTHRGVRLPRGFRGPGRQDGENGPELA